jgi:cytochrome P450
MVLAEKLKPCVPEHVRQDIVWDNDFAAYLSELDDPYWAAGRLHDGPGIIWASNASYGKPAWIFTRHALIEEGFADYRKFSSARGSLIAAVMDPDWLLLPVEADPPGHHYYRQALRPFFTPGAIAKRTAEVQGLCNSLIDGFVDRGRCEFVSEFGSILPNAIVVSMLGMPQYMLRQFVEWEETAIHGADNAERFAAGRAIIDYLKGFIAEQKAHPQSELMQGIFSGRVNDRPFTDAEILGICYLLFVAGLDTVFSSLGWMMRHLAIDQALQTRLRNNPHDIPAAVEEFTRAFGVSAPSRTVAEDMIFHGVAMKKGEDVLLPTYLAGRDPLAFPNPHVIDIGRKPRHVTFGVGLHVCLGIHLAKREIRIVIESFLSRMKNIRMPDGKAFQYHTTGTIGMDWLNLAWDPA